VIAVIITIGWAILDGPLFRMENVLSRDHPHIQEAPISFTVITVNVGNSDLRCLPFILKLCDKDVEDRIAANIQRLKPDVVAIQETLPPYMCEPLYAPYLSSVCRESQEVPQVRRLLGEDYSIVCETRNGFECIGVRTDAGIIQGCEPGSSCETDRMDIQGEGCRPNVAVMVATVEVNGRVFDLVNAHPESRGAACRKLSIQQIFEDRGSPGALVQEPDVFIVGDLNLDPWVENDVSTRYWNQQVGSPDTHEFYYHSGIVERDPPYPSIVFSVFRRTYDHVVSNFLQGTTVTLGMAPGTTRLDGGRGMDHLGIYGELFFQD
jgi:hypothetical protein